MAVVLQHFVNTFLPWMDDSQLLDDQAGIKFFTLPIFRATYAGTLSVFVFFVLSGLVLSHKYFVTLQQFQQHFSDPTSRQFQLLRDALIRRLPRLLIPTIIVALPSYILFVSRAYHNAANPALKFINLMNVSDDYRSFSQYIMQSFFCIWASAGGNNYIPVTWTITYEIYGSFLVFAVLLALVGTYSRHQLVFLALTSLVIFPVAAAWYTPSLLYYSEFLKGILIAKLLAAFPHNFEDSRPRWNIPPRARLVLWNVFGMCLFLVGLGLGSYPASFNNGEVGWSNMKTFTDTTWLSHIWYWMASSFIFLGLMCSSWLKTLFSTAPFVYLGKISFPIYLVHLQLLASVGTTVFTALQDKLDYGKAVGVTFVVFMLVTLIVSHIGIRLIDQPSITLSRWFQEIVTCPVEQAKEEGTSQSMLKIDQVEVINVSLDVDQIDVKDGSTTDGSDTATINIV
ncbi:hypothetical protein HDV00_002678 [Rhizophlyctis rosea]|nr:hypothetical protein HDV00_002678 [Rhizophlyctis rosea]